MGVLDPVHIETLAAHLRDGDWLDVRSVDVGSLERVQVTALLIHRDDEEIEFTQDGGAVVMVMSDSIRRVVPTAFEEGDEITPLATAQLEFADQVEKVWIAAEHAVAAMHNIPDMELFRDLVETSSGHLHMRYWVMLTVETFNVAKPLDIAKHYSYSSIQPMVSARSMRDRAIREGKVEASVMDDLNQDAKAHLGWR